MNFIGGAAEHLADAIEATASRDLYAAAPAVLRLQSPVVGGATLLVAPTLPVTYCNRVIGLGNDELIETDDLEEIAAVYSAAGVRSYWLHLTPSAQRPAVIKSLTQRGYKLAARRSWAKFLRDVERPVMPRTELTLRKATTQDADTVAAVVCVAYAMPATIAPWFAALVGRRNWQVWVATHHDKIVATGSVFLHNDTAWLGIGATLPEYRGRGAQSALLAARIHTAATAGCTVIATETGEPVSDEPNPSLRNIRRLGFRQVCSRMNWAAPEAT